LAYCKADRALETKFNRLVYTRRALAPFVASGFCAPPTATEIAATMAADDGTPIEGEPFFSPLSSCIDPTRLWPLLQR